MGQEPVTMSNAMIDSLNGASDPYYKGNRHFGLDHYKRLLKHATANKYTRGLIDSHYNLGQYYNFINKKVDSAIYHYDQGILLIQKTGVSRKDFPTFYNNKASALYQEGMFFLASASYEKSYEASLEFGNEKGITNSQTNLAEMNMALGNYEKAISLSLEQLEREGSAIDLNIKSIIYGRIGACLVKTKKTKKGLKYLKMSDSIYQIDPWDDRLAFEVRAYSAQAHMDLGDPKKAIALCEAVKAEFPDQKINMKFTQLTLGKALLQDNQIQKGIRVLEEGLAMHGTKDQQIIILETLGFAYLSQKNLRKSQPLITEAIRQRDSMQKARAKRFSSYSSVSYNLLESEYKNDTLSHENQVLEAKAERRELTQTLLILSVFVLLLLIIGYVLWKKYRSGKNAIRTLKVNEKKMLEAHIKQREDELGATMAHLNKSMITLKAITTDLGKNIRNKDYTNLENIENALIEYQESSSTTALLTDRVESQYPRMTAQLLEIYPDFTPNDIRHCLMIKLGLSLKETARLLNITVAAVKSARGRMRKKMDIDSNASLKRHLNSLSNSA